MEKKTGNLLLLFVFASLAFFGCFSPWKGDEATLTLLFGNSPGGRAAAPDDATLSWLVLNIDLSGPTGRQSHTVKGNTFSVTVMPGYWNISVRALLNTTLYAQGEIGAEIKAGRNNQVEIKMELATKDNFIFVTKDSDSSDGENPEPGSLRYALVNTYDENTTIMVMLAQGSEIQLKHSLIVDVEANLVANLVIEGNGIILSKSDEPWESSSDQKRLMTIWGSTDTDFKVTIRRFHFKDGAGAIDNRGIISLESCIFSNNNAGGYSGGAIYNYGEKLEVKGCTFYDNHTDEDGGAINNYGSIELTGNLFYGNTSGADAYGENIIVSNNGGTITSNGYNVVDLPFGIADGESGWAVETEDTTFRDLGISGIPIDTSTFKPVSALNSIVPNILTDFPTTDFYGKPRNFPGAPGAVNW